MHGQILNGEVGQNKAQGRAEAASGIEYIILNKPFCLLSR